MTLKLSEPFVKKYQMFEKLAFHIIAETKDELDAFINQHHEQLDIPKKNRDDDDYKIEQPHENREIVEILVRRYNMTLIGQKQEFDKVEFLEQFGFESIKAIVYATDFCPSSMAVDQFCTLVLAAYENFGDSYEFDERVQTLHTCKTHEEYGKLHLQITLIRQLLFGQ